MYRIRILHALVSVSVTVKLAQKFSVTLKEQCNEIRNETVAGSKAIVNFLLC